MQARPWFAMVVVGALAGPAPASPCSKQLAAYDKWIAPVKAEVASGAITLDAADRLVATSAHPAAPPPQPAVMLVVDADGLHDGHGPARPASEAADLIASNTNISFARDNPQAISHGIVVLAHADAHASDVRAAVTAALASHEQVWLAFRAAGRKSAAPARSAVTDEVGRLGPSDVDSLVTLIRREFGKCGGLMTMMQELGGETQASQLQSLTVRPRAALAACRCKEAPGIVASILWKLSFENLGVVVAVPAARAAKLPWGAASATWNDVAAGVVKALAR